MDTVCCVECIDDDNIQIKFGWWVNLQYCGLLLDVLAMKIAFCCWCFMYQRLITVLIARILPKIQIFLSIIMIWKKIQLLSYWIHSILCWLSTRMATRLWEYKHTDFSLIIRYVDFDLFERVSRSIYDCTEVSPKYWYQHAYLGHR